MKVKVMTLITEVEQDIGLKLANASLPPYSAHKRFVRDIANGHTLSLSDSGRAFLAYIAHRYRRQCRFNAAEREWLRTWGAL